MEPKDPGAVPVSYTHLDVYKRQKLDIFLQHYFDANGFFYYLHDRVIDATMRII